MQTATNNTQLLEVLYDLTWNLAKSDLEFADSRERFAILHSWAYEFQTVHADTDWSKTDYLETVDAFYELKVGVL